MAFRSDIKNYYLKNASLIVPHDWEINIYASILGNLYFYNEPLTLYRIHQNNTLGINLYIDEIKNCFNQNCQTNFDFKTFDHNIAKFFLLYYPKTSDTILNELINQFIKDSM